MDGREGAVPVLNDPQFGLTAILRPYVGFDAITPGVSSYQGQSGQIPIMFTEGSVAYDPQAGMPGYSKRLVKGLAVPFGARISLWLPIMSAFGPNSTTVNYRWQIIWRQRNVFDYRIQRIPFHYPKQGLGAPDDPLTGDTPVDRVVIPAAQHTIVINDPGPDPTAAAPGAISVPIKEQFQPGRPTMNPPLGPVVPGITVGNQIGVIEQGVSTLSSFLGYAPTFCTVEVQAIGDEFLLACTKLGSNLNWDFTNANPVFGEDVGFGALFGTAGGLIPAGFPDVGIYVNAGVAT